MKPTTHSAALGSRIRTARLRAGQSQRDLAEAVQLDYHAIGLYEAGARKVRRATLVAIAQALGITPEEIDPDYLS